MKKILPLALIIIIAGGAGFGVQRYLQQDAQNLPALLPDSAKEFIIGSQRPAFELKDLEGKLRHIDEWNGKVLLVNFWATWCPPCKKEMPGFIELHEKYAEQGFEIIGIALDDIESVQDFADTLGVNYTIMPADYAGLELSRKYGNRIGALPYSVFISKTGIIKASHAGELSKKQVEQVILPLLAE